MMHGQPSNQQLLEHIGLDTRLWSPSLDSVECASHVLADKVVLLYFSAHWCGPCRKFTPVLKDLYATLRSRHAERFEVVLCSMDAFETEYNHYAKTMPWWCLSFQSPAVARLANLYKAEGLPSLVIVDTDGSVITHDAVPQVSNDPLGNSFPWRPQKFIDLLPEQYYHRPGELAHTRDLDDKYLLLFTGGEWCEPCRMFTNKLVKAYQRLRQIRSDFEILFMSSDFDEVSFNDFYSQMPFGAIPYEYRTAKAEIAKKYNINRIPTVMVFGPRPPCGRDRPLINADVREIFENGDYLSEFPFHPKMFGDLNKTTYDINKTKAVVIFCESGDDSEQEDVADALTMAAKARYGFDEPKFFWVFEPSHFSKTLRNALRLPVANEDPVMVLLDMADHGAFYLSKDSAPTSCSILEFIDKPGRRRQI